MGREQRPGNADYEETTALVQKLDALKQRGSNLLVVGSRMPDAHETACRQFLGETTTEARRRLFVLADTARSSSDRPSLATADPDRHAVVRYDTAARSAAVTATNLATTPDAAPPTERATENELGRLGTAISEVVAEFEATSGGLSAAELRLCFDSLTPLISEHDPETVFRFLHLLTHRVRGVGGMGHYHLTADRSNRTVALLEPLFDAVIELCFRDGELYQRWYLHDGGLTTGWLQL
ncbi:DUF7504 family protein [Halalkalicoccus subterraneus]|uniref:DUF7504 family protein n=1 Tax=Halalkalicoccus subterraneus TaxID=2675002 RepID=UPI000EFA460A|nr:hypothetical protein [Halalkalicoccus subterraneus]